MTTPSDDFLLDTHIWLRYVGVSGSLRPAVLPILDAAAVQHGLYISAISIWEIALLVKRKRLSLHPNINAWVKTALSQPGINLLPFSPKIAIESVNLPEPMHKDPSDRIIVASARVEGLRLVTRDKEILEFAALTNLPVLRA
jgi:PIN domain nuclease of toxin-antitoxin system